MKLTKLLPAIIAPLISLAPNLTAIADAQSDTQRAFRGRCTAEILGQEKGTRVNMRSAPGVESEIVGYVLVGQQVWQLYYTISGYSPIVRQSDNEGVNWDYVEYRPSKNAEYRPSGTRGWIASYLLDQTCSSSKRPFDK
jgi:hypothetical protein